MCKRCGADTKGVCDDCYKILLAEMRGAVREVMKWAPAAKELLKASEFWLNIYDDYNSMNPMSNWSVHAHEYGERLRCAIEAMKKILYPEEEYIGIDYPPKEPEE